MSSIGPQLPPHLTKRKRTPEDGVEDPSSPPTKLPRNAAPSKNNDEIDLDGSDSDDAGYGPTAPPGPRPAISPALPPPGNTDEIDLASDSDTGPAPPRPVGPSRPAQPAQSAQSAQPESESESDSDSDGYGPSLPTASTVSKPAMGPSLPPSEPAPQRDSWMLAPPTASAYSERDPTRLRARKFASNPSSKPAPSDGPSIWTETPEEKLQRLQDAVLGRRTAEDAPAADRRGPKADEEDERQRRIAANIEAQRGKSLYDEHQNIRDKSGADKEEEDDPSKRGFDREKDMALGGKIGTSQRKELMTKAANFGGRFQKGSYL